MAVGFRESIRALETLGRLKVVPFPPLKQEFSYLTIIY